MCVCTRLYQARGRELEIETVLECVSKCVSRASELEGETDSVCARVCVFSIWQGFVMGTTNNS